MLYDYPLNYQETGVRWLGPSNKSARFSKSSQGRRESCGRSRQWQTRKCFLLNDNLRKGRTLPKARYLLPHHSNRQFSGEPELPEHCRVHYCGRFRKTRSLPKARRFVLIWFALDSTTVLSRLFAQVITEPRAGKRESRPLPKSSDRQCRSRTNAIPRTKLPESLTARASRDHSAYKRGPLRVRKVCAGVHLRGRSPGSYVERPVHDGVHTRVRRCEQKQPLLNLLVQGERWCMVYPVPTKHKHSQLTLIYKQLVRTVHVWPLPDRS